MKYIIEHENIFISASFPRVAVRKLVRKIVKGMRDKSKDIFEFQNQPIAVINELNVKSEYLVSIVKPLTLQQKSIYYDVDYEIEFYKKMANI